MRDLTLCSDIKGVVALFDFDYESAKYWNPAGSELTTAVTEWMDGDAELNLESSGEIAVELMQTPTDGGSMKTHVNLPNTG